MSHQDITAFSLPTEVVCKCDFVYRPFISYSQPSHNLFLKCEQQLVVTKVLFNS